MSILENVVSDSSPQRGEVKCGGHTAHADDTLALLILTHCHRGLGTLYAQTGRRSRPTTSGPLTGPS